MLPAHGETHINHLLCHILGAQVIVYMPVPDEPELMYKMVDRVLVSVHELVAFANIVS